MAGNNTVVSVIGLGYVGLPVAVEFAKQFDVVGFDINERRIRELSEGHDRNDEITSAELLLPRLEFTASIDNLRRATFHIVAVPTPIDDAKQPDLTPVIGASKIVGKALKKGDIVVYESTV